MRGETVIGRLRDLLPLRFTLELGDRGPEPLPWPGPAPLSGGVERTYVLEEVDLRDRRSLRPVPEEESDLLLAPELRAWRSDVVGGLQAMGDPLRVAVRVGMLMERAGYREQRVSQAGPVHWRAVFWSGGGGPDPYICGEGTDLTGAYVDAVRQAYAERPGAPRGVGGSAAAETPPFDRSKRGGGLVSPGDDPVSASGDGCRYE